MTAVIVCNGSISNYQYFKDYFNKADLIIAVDGGAAHLKRFDVKPHLLLGDFDSISDKDLSFYKNLGIEILNFPKEKDMTDTELAVEIAIKRGCRFIIMIGALGTREDHSLSNIFILKMMLDRGVQGLIINENNEITLIKDKIELNREENMNITLLPLSERVEGVTTKGLYYPLHNATINMGSSWGVSNKFTEDKAEVTIRSGLMLVIKSRD
jgi:thiamine pyrophosphokinase